MTRCVDNPAPRIVTRTYAELAALPAAALALFADPIRGSLFATATWFECVVAAGLPSDAQPRFVALALEDRVAAIVPMRLDVGGARLEGLTTPYTCLFGPLLADGLSASQLGALGCAFGQFCRGWPLVRLDALNGEDDAVARFLAGARAAGLRSVRFAHFANWHEDCAGATWPDYLRARPGGLRETIRRKLAKAERDPAVAFEILRDALDAPRAVAVYESVYARSWKDPEPFPAFNATLIARAAGAGILRLGVLSLAGSPVAVQLWVVGGGVATVLKLAHDEAARAISPGTVLTAMMMRHLLEAERVNGIDFGRGDDAYKQGWASRRRERIGVILYDPLSPRGAGFALRHHAGRLARRLRGG